MAHRSGAIFTFYTLFLNASSDYVNKVSYVCVGQCDGQPGWGLRSQTQLLLPQIIKLHTLREGLGLNLNTGSKQKP